MKKQLLLVGVLLLTASCASKQKTESVSVKPVEPKKETQQASVTMSSEYKRSLENVSMSCARSADIRKVEIEAKSPKGCELFYSSYGNRNKVAWSDSGDSHCAAVKTKIETNLKAAGYQCQTPERASASEQKTGK